jgi:drug/metabolite transporter (DMT)-like permease
MSVQAAYIGVIVIWTTTPLAIKWSGEGSHFLFAVTARMFIAAVLSLVILKVTRTPLPWHKKARDTYLVGGLGIFGAMMLVYWGAQYIPSGWISIIFGLAPIVTGLMASLWLGEKNLTSTKLFGMVLGLGGLAIVFGGSASINQQAGLGAAAVLAATLIHCASAVWIKRIGAGIPALASTAGGVTVATFLMQTTWIALDTQLPVHVTTKALWAIIYLGLAGSVLGFSLYYYLLKHAEATRVALITLITPVSALILGNRLNGEALTINVILGTTVILLGLVLFQFGEGWLHRARRINRKRRATIHP